MNRTAADKNSIRIRGARQNNLKNLSVDFECGKLTVVTGVSGSGKSSLVFDTLYAEGQRRYVETFSPYVRQFMDKMDSPLVDKIEGVPPAIAIDQTNPVRTSRSTVGTMTELNDFLKMLFAQAASLYCPHCGKPVSKDNPESIWKAFLQKRRELPDDTRYFVKYTFTAPSSFPAEDTVAALAAQGFTRVIPGGVSGDYRSYEVIVDRFKGTVAKSRAIAAVELSLQKGKGQVVLRGESPDGTLLWEQKYSDAFCCADCGLSFSNPHESTFSFNSPLGACETCRGFGRTIGVDYGLVVPDEGKTLKEGAVKPWQSPSFSECQDDLMKYAAADGIDVNVPFRDLPEKDKNWVFYGNPSWSSWRQRKWYGVKNFFDWLETKAYKMHVRVLLSRYRSYNTCPTCRGARLKSDALQWRVGSLGLAQQTLGTRPRSRPLGADYPDEVLQSLPGLNISDLMQLPLSRLRYFFEHLEFTGVMEKACEMLLGEIRTRLRFLNEVGVGYLTLDRQSRTLSGGEVQRINLTTALGTSLVNTLFVLDEPSIGLHPQEMDKINQVMMRLRNNGNTLVVVEHDPQVMLCADRIIDMGPGPGERGGRIVFDGTPQELKHAATLTGKYLSGKMRIPKAKKQKIRPTSPAVVLLGARENNLKNLDIRIPLKALVCIAGVSGSGKSTLVQNTLVPALLKAKGKTTEAPGAYDCLKGAELVDDVIFVDQSPIGKTTRSNPAVFMGAFDAIRRMFAATPLAKARGYTAGTFSFNSGTGRCPTCEGSGFEHIEMQFLSDVYLSCPDCGGTRYRHETLEVKIHAADRDLSIADVLNMTVREALDAFASNKEIVRTLTPLVKVGLSYLRLGQPVPTLSGGESQRLKLAKHLAEAVGGRKEHTIFFFDEPTTGLHFDDIALLMRSLRELVDAGHSVVIVEHNLDVIDASDWVIELGPEGGEGGGDELFAGTPNSLAISETPTGEALAAYRTAIKNNETSPFLLSAENLSASGTQNRTDTGPEDSINVVHAREHNLKNISVSVPRDKFTVVTGVSGSGKSTLAFDLIFNEGQRRYLESLNAYARSIVQPASRPDVDAIYGIPPTVAIEQRTSRGGQKSTVATLTEIYHFLRLLYVKLGVQYCPNCRIPVTPLSFDSILARLVTDCDGKKIEVLAPLVQNRKGIYKDLAHWAQTKGYQELIVDGRRVPTRGFPSLDRYREHTIKLPVASVTVSKAHEAQLRHVVSTALEYGKGTFEVVSGASSDVYSTERSCPQCGTSFPEPDPRLFSYNSRLGWCPSCLGNGLKLFKNAIDEDNVISEMNEEGADLTAVCPDCSGTRLNPTARSVLFRGRPITDIAGMSIDEALRFFESLDFEGREAAIAEAPVKEIVSRLRFLQEVGLSYLSLDRSAPTLSGGEAQRIRLASQLGTNLQGVCYVLDEPTIGLHPRDNKILLNALGKLADKGNTLLVVEHDEDTIRMADHVIDIGPGAGVRGGRLIAQGSIEDLMKAPDSVTGKYLRHPLEHKNKTRIKTDLRSDPCVEVVGAKENNVNIDSVRFPLNRLTVVTGVSGSGKSTLARKILFSNLQQLVQTKGKAAFSGCTDILGWEKIDRVLEVDQTPIGKTPRSCPATYIGFWDLIRKLFAETNEAKERGYGPSRFSFNLKEGRCPACEGQGMQTVEMSFLPDVKVECDVCGSLRFNDETLQVKWKDKTIGEVLQMEVDEALEFFASQPSIAHPLQLMKDVGLGYLTLGQPSPTLSGGEAQRLKLVSELTKVRDDIATRGKKQPHTLYVLDEPTVGLHMADVEKLLSVLHRLVDVGNTVIVIEHDLDVIAEADWIVDMGPEGGENGGRIVFAGTPKDIQKKKTYTGLFLGEFIKFRKTISMEG
jgi:excinuclease ABC subunit A